MEKLNFKNNYLKTIKSIGLFILIFLMFICKDIILLIPLKLLNVDYSNLSVQEDILISLVSSIILAIIIFFIYKNYLKKSFTEHKKNFLDNLELGMKYYFIGLFGMFVFNILINKFSPIHEANNEVLVQEMLKQAPFLTFISASVLAPFLEEMLFRKSLGDIFNNKKIMVFVSGLAFGLLHVIFSLKTPWDLLYTIPYGMLGGSFAYILYKKDNIFIPITFHMFHNAFLTLTSIILSVIAK